MERLRRAEQGSTRIRRNIRISTGCWPRRMRSGGAVHGFTLTYDHFDPEAELLREAMTSTGNGYFCTRGTAEWEDVGPAHYPGTYVHGGYNRETTIFDGN